MTADELDTVKEEFNKLVLDNPTLRDLVRQLGRLVAHLESEQEKRSEATKMSKHHESVLYGNPDDDNKPGLVIKVNTMWRWHTKLATLGGAAAGTILTLLFKHFFP